MGALVDCELVRSGFFAQPVNTVTTLAFFAAGVWLLRRRTTAWIGMALIATGVGSFVFHGPMPAWGEWAHDVSLSWLIVVVGGVQSRWESWSRWPALAGLALLFALLPEVADPVGVGLTAFVAGSILVQRPTRDEMLALGLLGAAAVFGRLGSTGWPLCDPTSIFQPHGVWHVTAAVAVAWWANAQRI